jgi:hypothetical protein
MEEDFEGWTWIFVQLCWNLRLWRTSRGRALTGRVAEAESNREVRADGPGRDGGCEAGNITFLYQDFGASEILPPFESSG